MGDNAEMCLIELVDFNELYTNESGSKKAKSTSAEVVAEKLNRSKLKLQKVAEEVVENVEEAKGRRNN